MKPQGTSAAQTLSQALPYLQRYAESIIVIKLGGHAMGSAEALAQFARDVVLMQRVGIHPMVVHGGGPMIEAMLKRLGMRTSFVAGKRVSDAATVEIVEMVLSGCVNKGIVQAFGQQGGKAVGLSGKDASLMICVQTDPALGLVGTPVEINPGVLHDLLARGMIPVVAPIGAGRAGEPFNINGDTAAGAIAAALRADRLLLLTDVAGIKGADGTLIEDMQVEDIAPLIGDGVISGGMIPKAETAASAIRKGVRAVAIVDGRTPHACLLELLTEHGAGTLIRP